MDQYFESLRFLRDHCLSEQIDLLLPGHGPVSATPVELIEFYEKHRLERLSQVKAAVAEGYTTIEAVTAAVYKDIDKEVLPAAQLTVAAQLEYLKKIDA
jgi:glyoxylase-like metal-dependent hydrolase (beta-lactamase superfamily II)